MNNPGLMFTLLSCLLATMLPLSSVMAEDFAGASGMAILSDDAYLCVQDLKADKPGSRVGVLTVDIENGGYDYAPLEPDWQGELPHDLESVFGFTTRPGEFLLCESGAYENWTTHEYHIGRIFHVMLREGRQGWELEVLGTFPIPEHIHEIEGMFCLSVANPEEYTVRRDVFGDVAAEHRRRVSEANAIQDSEPEDKGTDETSDQVVDGAIEDDLGPYSWGTEYRGSITADDLPERELGFVILVSRGGDMPYELPKFYDNLIDLKGYELRQLNEGRGKELRTAQMDDPFTRGCSDVYVDPSGVLWIAGCTDQGDNGPFDSFIYRYGEYEIEDSFYSPSYSAPGWKLSGVKVEAICPSVFPGATLCYATDDEGFGGIWRSLGAANTERF